MAGKGRRRRKVGVCVECRQQKLKCNTEDTFPDPCARCVAKEVPCTIDSTFKRTAARQRTREMAAELVRLRKERSTISPSAANANDQNVHFGPVQHPKFGQVDRRTWGTTTLQTASLGNMTFTAEDISTRFTTYLTHFHPIFPIINPSTPPAALQQHSPFLLWTIILITCRYHLVPPSDFRDLEDYQITLAQKASTTAPMTLHTIQALLISCNWPVHPRHMVSDASYLQFSAMIAGARFLNLDRQFGRYNYYDSQISERDLLEMRRTWIGMFIMSWWLEFWYGTQGLFHRSLDLDAIEKQIQAPGLPEEMAAEASMVLVLARFQRAVAEERSAEGIDVLVEQHSSDLNMLMHRSIATWTDRLQFVLLLTRLRIRISSIMACDAPSPPTDPDSSHLTGRIVSTLPIAIGIIETYASLLAARTEEPAFIRDDILSRRYLRAVIFASFFLIGFCCANEACGPGSRKRATQSVERAREIFLSCARAPRDPTIDDGPGRAAVGLRLLLDNMGAPRTADLGGFRDRGESSIIWEGLRRIFGLRGRASSRTDLLRYIDPIGYGSRPVGGTGAEDAGGIDEEEEEEEDEGEGINSHPFFGEGVAVDDFGDFEDFEWT